MGASAKGRLRCIRIMMPLKVGTVVNDMAAHHQGVNFLVPLMPPYGPAFRSSRCCVTRGEKMRAGSPHQSLPMMGHMTLTTESPTKH